MFAFFLSRNLIVPAKPIIYIFISIARKIIIYFNPWSTYGLTCGQLGVNLVTFTFTVIIISCGWPKSSLFNQNMIVAMDLTTKAQKRARKLRECDIKAIANLVSTRKMTESDAVIMLGFKPNQWFSWKNKTGRSEKFSTIVARIRALHVDGLVSKIEAAGDDFEMTLPNGKTVTRRGDWRAPAWLLEKTAPQFHPQPLVAHNSNTINIGLMHDTLKRIMNDYNDADIKPTDSLQASLLSDSVTTHDNESKYPISHPKEIVANSTNIKMPIRKH